MRQWLMVTWLVLAPIPAGAQDGQVDTLAMPVAAIDVAGDLDEAAADALWEATASDDEEDCDLYLDEDMQAAVGDELYEATDPVSDVAAGHFDTAEVEQ
jgi:hypothetical protein